MMEVYRIKSLFSNNGKDEFIYVKYNINNSTLEGSAGRCCISNFVFCNLPDKPLSCLFQQAPIVRYTWHTPTLFISISICLVITPARMYRVWLCNYFTIKLMYPKHRIHFRIPLTIVPTSGSAFRVLYITSTGRVYIIFYFLFHYHICSLDILEAHYAIYTA